MVRLLLSAGSALVILSVLSGCGSNTSWYFCSGGPEFCSVDRDPAQPDPDEPQEEQPISAAALQIARSMPVEITAGLDLDGLETTAQTAPDLLAGWLLAGSLGLLLDDSDSAAAARFLDANRYWLSDPPELPEDNKLMDVGLELLGKVALTRDVVVAEQAAALGSKRAAAVDGDVTAAVSAEAESLLAGELARSMERAGSIEEDCCDAALLNAAAVTLCDELAATAAGEPETAACPVVRQWLSGYLGGHI